MDTARVNAALGYILEALADMVADKVADKLTERESTKEKDTNSGTYVNTTEETNPYSNTNNKNNIINNSVVVSSDSESCNHGNSVNYNHGNNITNTNLDSDEPTLDSITAYIAKCGYRFSPNKFYEFYTKNGWKTSNGINMKERWREFCDMWSKTEKKPLTTAQAATREERQALHPFQPTQFTQDGRLA